MSPVIEAHELTKRYGRKLAVRNLTFTVRPGEVTGFLGPNGAGKSTTLQLILGLLAPTSGSVSVGSRPPCEFPHGLHHIGALLDTDDVYGGDTAAAHLSSLARSNRIRGTRVEEVLAEAGLPKAAGRPIDGFSLCMRQRLGIATALLGDPPVLIFDEPLNGLDATGVAWARSLFKRLAAEGRTVFVSGHRISEMENTVDELIVIGRGELLAAGSFAEFAARHTRHSVLVRTPDATVLAEVLVLEGANVEWTGDQLLSVIGMSARHVGYLAFQNMVPVHELTLCSSSLEEAFLRLTADGNECPSEDIP